LKTYHYRRDLKRFDEVTVEEDDVNLLPRYILSKDEGFFKIAF